MPFHLRTGKCLAESRQVVTIGFREPALRMFGVDTRHGHSRRANELVINFSDPGSIEATFLAKEPGPDMRLATAKMEFHYENSFVTANNLEGYERLILEAMLGDQSLFTSSEGIERLWEVSTPLLEQPPPVQPYTRGSWGPAEITRIAGPYHWHLPDGA